MNVLSKRVRVETGAVISAKKMREWDHEYLEHGNFEEELRGGWKRDMFLEEYGYALIFSTLKFETISRLPSNLEDVINGHIFGECNKQRVTVYNGNII